jgi:hypothetical protein
VESNLECADIHCESGSASQNDIASFRPLPNIRVSSGFVFLASDSARAKSPGGIRTDGLGVNEHGDSAKELVVSREELCLGAQELCVSANEPGAGRQEL